MSWTLLVNSLGVGTGATVLALLAGFAVAMAAVASARWRGAVLACAAASLAMPPFLAANAWLDLMAGWRATGAPETVALRSLPLTALVLATLLWPITTFLVLGAWSKLRNEHLEAEPMMRGGRLVGRLLLPAARYELGIAGVVTLALALANFTVPTLFQVRVFTEEFWIRFNTQFDTAGALRAAWPLLLLPLALLVLMRGRDVMWPRRRPVVDADLLARQLCGWQPVAAVVTVLWNTLSIGFPLAKISFAKRTWTELPGAIDAGGNAIANSVVAAAGTATLLAALSLISTDRTSDGRGRVAPRIVRWLGLAVPCAGWIIFLLPGVVLGVALIWAFNRPVLDGLYHSTGIVLTALAVRYLAPARALVAQASASVDTELADAARSAGAGRWRVFRDVRWPQMRDGVAAAWYAVYLLCLWDVETVVLIQPPGGETLALRIFNLLHYGHAAQVNALCVVMLGLAIAPLAAWCVWRKVSVRRTTYDVRRSTRLGTWLALGAMVFAGGAFCGCSPGVPSDTTPLDSKLFSSVQVIGSRGVAPGHFNKPRSLVCDRDDNLYVADITGRIQKFSPDGRWLLQWQMPQTDLGKPKGMGLDPDGNIIVVEPHYMRVNHFTPEGKLAARWGVKGTNAGQFILPRGITVSSRGDFYVSEYTVVDRVQRFAFVPVAADVRSPRPSGLPAGPLTGLPVPFRWFGSEGKLGPAYVGCRMTGGWGAPGLATGEFNRAEGLGIGPRDEVFVADSCNHRIQVFDADGKFLRTHGRAGSTAGALSYPYDIRVDAQGLQFVCEFGNSRVSLFDAQDRLVETIGGPGAAPGRFANPWAVALDSKGNLYVADSQNHRVQKLVRRSPVAADVRRLHISPSTVTADAKTEIDQSLLTSATAQARTRP